MRYREVQPDRRFLARLETGTGRRAGTESFADGAGTVFVREIYLESFDRPLERECDPALDLDPWL